MISDLPLMLETTQKSNKCNKGLQYHHSCSFCGRGDGKSLGCCDKRVIIDRNSGFHSDTVHLGRLCCIIYYIQQRFQSVQCPSDEELERPSSSSLPEVVKTPTEVNGGRNGICQLYICRTGFCKKINIKYIQLGM